MDKIKRYKYILVGIFVALILIVSLIAAPIVAYRNTIFPIVTIADTNVGGLTTSEAVKKLQSSHPQPENITLIAPEKTYTIPSADIDLSYNYDASVHQAFTTPRTSILSTVIANFQTYSFPLEISVDKLLLNEYLSVIAEEITSEPIYPSLSVDGTSVTVLRGEIGTDIDIVKLQEQILQELREGTTEPISISILTIDPTISDATAQQFQVRGENFLDSTLSLSAETKTFDYSGQELLDFLAPNNSYNSTKIDSVIDTISSQVNREPINPVFVFENNRVTEFSPARDGLTVQTDVLSTQIKEALSVLDQDQETTHRIDIPLTVVAPSITTAEVNDLGIKERIGLGTSQFKGSISSRIHNIGLGSSKFNGVLIKPGDEFSFNQTIGDISALTGYKQSYVIQDGKTILGDGGGVCQVSTTLFRAALDAGLPIVERRAHSYRVTYYEQGTPPGLDATVYSPTTDFKIKNDTPNYILIQTLFDPTNATLQFELYGTDDGREVELSKPVITSQSPPPEDYFQDDPTLPAGTVKQIDWAAWGAKVQFAYKVTRGEEILQDEIFYSNYRPWQAKFLRGTGPTI